MIRYVKGICLLTLSGNFHDMPIKVFESRFPALITEYGYRQDSAGPGRWRGGNGIIRYMVDGEW